MSVAYGIGESDQSLVAILKNGCHDHQGMSLWWPNIQFLCSFVGVNKCDHVQFIDIH